MGWRQISADDVIADFTPSEAKIVQTVQNSTSRLALKLSDTVAKWVGAMSAANYPVNQDGSVPDQLREHVAAMACWAWIRGVPQFKTVQTKAREDAQKDAQRIFEKICARTYGAIEAPYGTDFRTGNWNSENKLLMRTHPIPPPNLQFQFSGGTRGTSNDLTFTGPTGTVPPFPPANVGMEALNTTTGDEWVVNNNFVWQLDND